MQKFGSHLENLLDFPVVYGNINGAYYWGEGQTAHSISPDGEANTS